MTCYFLSCHVHLCIADDHVVLLDLERDQYLAVRPSQMNALAGQVQGWPAREVLRARQGVCVQEAVAEPDQSAERLIAEMLAARVLTRDAAAGKDARPFEIEPPNAALLEESLHADPEINARHVLRFLRASLATVLAMKCRPLKAVLAGIEARKARRRHGRASLDLAQARALVGAFINLRPLVLGARDLCLFDSFALMRFLSYYGLFPQCVIGVQTAPFGAHCWVQEGGITFNDSPENVRRFTPILAI